MVVDAGGNIPLMLVAEENSNGSSKRSISTIYLHLICCVEGTWYLLP